MKMGITKYELFALTSHLVVQPSPNPEHGRRRLRAWDELRVAELADDLAAGNTVLGAELNLPEWRDKKTLHLVDLTAEIVDYLIAGLGVQVAGAWADTLTRLRERIEQLRDKKYKLPPELRAQPTA